MADGTGLREESVDHERGSVRRRSRRGAGPLPAWLRRAGLVARTNLRRQYRTARAHPWFAFAYLFSLAFGLFVAVGRAPLPGLAAWPYPGGYELGRQFAAGDAVLDRVRGFGGVLFVLLVLVTVLKEATDSAMDTHVDALVLAAGVRGVAVGGVLWSLLLTGSQFGVIVLAGATAFGVGAGSAPAGVGLALAGVALLLAAVPVGFVFALGIRLAFQRVPLLREHRLLVGAPLAVVYFGLFARARASMALLSDSPLGRFADPGFALVGAVPPGRGVLALALAATASVGATALAVPLSARVWLGEDHRGAEESTAEADYGPRERRLDRLVGRPVAAVARSVWLRVRRAPRSLLFAAMSAALAGTVALELVSRVPAALPAVVAVYGAATVGMGATLNPLGAAGVGLPAALTTADGGRSLVRGYALSAALPGVPLVAGATLVTGLATGLPAALVVATAVLGAVLAAVGAVVSLVVGLAVPNVDGLRPTGSGLQPPKLLATTAFLLVTALLGSPALAGAGVTGRSPTLSGALAGVGVSAAVASLAGVVAYRRAVQSVAEYRIE